MFQRSNGAYIINRFIALLGFVIIETFGITPCKTSAQAQSVLEMWMHYCT